MATPAFVNPARVVVMGVSGSGKSTVGRPLAAKLGWTVQSGDDLHPAANIAKMSRGEPLDDADRAPWLAACGRWLERQSRAGRGGVITCSALRRSYRDSLRDLCPDLRLVWLKGDFEVIAARVARRAGHFMPPELLASQFKTLEPPAPEETPIMVDITFAARRPGGGDRGSAAASDSAYHS